MSPVRDLKKHDAQWQVAGSSGNGDLGEIPLGEIPLGEIPHGETPLRSAACSYTDRANRLLWADRMHSNPDGPWLSLHLQSQV